MLLVYNLSTCSGHTNIIYAFDLKQLYKYLCGVCLVRYNSFFGVVYTKLYKTEMTKMRISVLLFFRDNCTSSENGKEEEEEEKRGDTKNYIMVFVLWWVKNREHWEWEQSVHDKILTCLYYIVNVHTMCCVLCAVCSVSVYMVCIVCNVLWDVVKAFFFLLLCFSYFLPFLSFHFFSVFFFFCLYAPIIWNSAVDIVSPLPFSVQKYWSIFFYSINVVLALLLLTISLFSTSKHSLDFSFALLLLLCDYAYTFLFSSFHFSCILFNVCMCYPYCIWVCLIFFRRVWRSSSTKTKTKFSVVFSFMDFGFYISGFYSFWFLFFFSSSSCVMFRIRNARIFMFIVLS